MIDVDYCADKRKQLEERHKASVVHTKPSKDSKKATLKYESTHIQMMAKLRDCYGHLGLHFPLSLDESGYELQEDDLDRRNAGQVLTRYLKRLQDSDSRMAAAGPERCRRGSAPPPTTTGRKKETVQPELPGRRASLQNWLDVAERPWPQVASGDLGTETESIRCQMLLVPQLWLWKIDNRTIITAFPERWDRQHFRSVLNKIQSDLPSADKIEDAVKDIIEVCINYIEDQFFVGKGQGMTCINVFATSITSVVSILPHRRQVRSPSMMLLSQVSQAERVTHCYAEFEKSIGYSFKTIKSQIRQEIRVLEEIDDILDEIGMIKRVLHDQELVMKKVLRWRHQGTTSRGANVVQGTDHLHQPLKHFKRLEEDANRVRSSLITLLDIRQREATIDEALENSRQSKALFVFTLITILFAPLSFCEQLLAIPILELEARLPARWVAKVSGKPRLGVSPRTVTIDSPALTMLATVLFAGALLYLYPKIFSASLSSLGDPISSTSNSNNSKAQEVPPKGGRFNYVWRFRPKRQTKRAKPDDPELCNWQALT
ncbi:hypothetical protein B0J14DRAFT_242157 [Halenospora varia]|nr:hypothetical protein B0J14DRAFT_242157 [Halenospora varia]